MIEAMMDDLLNPKPYDKGWYTGFAISTVVTEVVVYILSAGTGAGNAVTLPSKFLILANRIGPKLAKLGGKFVLFLNRIGIDVDLIGNATARVGGFVRKGLDLVDCFPAGTLVQTIDGPRNIEDLRRGDMVLSRDEQTGRVDYRPVRQTFVNHTDTLYYVTYDVDGDGPAAPVTIRTTGGHPFYVASDGFIPAEDLGAGDDLLLSDGTQVEVLSVVAETTSLDRLFRTYNFSVGEFETYFVGEDGVWVHNARLDTRKLCEVVYDQFENVRKAFPNGDDIVKAYQDTIRKIGVVPDHTRMAFVEEVIKDLELLKQQNKLSQRLIDLAWDRDQGKDKFRELFAALRWEEKNGKRLRRPLPGVPIESGADFVEEGNPANRFGLKGPFGRGKAKDNLDRIKDHIRDNPLGKADSNKLLVDLAGLDTKQRSDILKYLDDHYAGMYEKLEEAL